MYSDQLYQGVKDEIQELVDPLFEFGKNQISERGDFLPLGAALELDGSVGLKFAAPENEPTTSEEVLPLLHKALRQCQQDGVMAIAVCESVRITTDEMKMRQAVKVLIEHTNGLTVAMYLPMRKRLFRGWETGEVFMNEASPEVGVHPDPSITEPG